MAVVKEYSARRPGSAYLKNLVGVWELHANHPEQARQAFQEAIAADPAYAAPALLLGEMHLGAGNAKDARLVLGAVVARDPKNVRAAFLLALAEEQAGNPGRAVILYRSVLDRQPAHPQALNNLAGLLAGVDPDEALRFAQKAVEMSPGDAAMLDTLGWVYYRKGMYRLAVDNIGNAVKKGESAVRRYHLAMAYEKLGDRVEARNNMTAALRLNPNVAAVAKVR